MPARDSARRGPTPLRNWTGRSSEEKVRRVQTAAASWLRAHPELARLELEFEAVGVRGRSVERVPLT